MGNRDLGGSSVRLQGGKDRDGVLLGRCQSLENHCLSSSSPGFSFLYTQGHGLGVLRTEVLFKAQDIVLGEKKSFLLFSP